MKLIDAHTHVFEQLCGFGPRGELRPIGGGRARWANGDEIEMIPPGLGERSFTADTLAALLRENHVERAVLLQGSFYGFQNEYVLESARHYPELFVPAATCDPFCKEAKYLLHRFIHEMGFRIVKFETSSGGGLMGYHGDFRIDGDVFREVFAMIAEAGATLVLDIGSPGMPSFQPEAVAEIAQRHPKMKILVCHRLAPVLGDYKILEEGLRILALHNVWFDLAAVPWNVAPETYPYPTGQGFVKLARQTVGAEKLVWGTDVPSPLTRENYENLWRYLYEGNIFSDLELEQVLYKNAKDVYPL